MTIRILPCALALISVAGLAAAQQPQRSVPPWARGRPETPATFRTEPYFATIIVKDGEGRPLRPFTPYNDLWVVVDKRYRLSVTVGEVPANATTEGARRTVVRFAPHDFMLDGKAHKVELRNGDRTTSYEMIFPRPTRR